MNKKHIISAKQQIDELTQRIPPILNADIVIYRPDLDASYAQGKYLIGKKDLKDVEIEKSYPKWLFPGGRVKYFENPQEAAERILKREIPGVKARLKKIATTVSDRGYDYRAYGVTIYFLFEYVSGVPRKNKIFEDFLWVNAAEMKSLHDVYPLDVSILSELDAAVRTMNTSQDEILMEVDKNNKEVGTIIKRDAHSNPKRFHRAAHIMIFNSKGEVVLQQRSLTKATDPGKWDMPGGHQVAGQTIKQTAQQELAEEMGINISLKLQRSGLYKDKNQSEYYFLFYGISDGPYGFDRNEVIQIKSFDCEKLLKHFYDKKYSILPHVYKYTEEFRFLWEKLKIAGK